MKRINLSQSYVLEEMRTRSHILEKELDLYAPPGNKCFTNDLIKEIFP